MPEWGKTLTLYGVRGMEVATKNFLLRYVCANIIVVQSSEIAKDTGFVYHGLKFGRGTDYHIAMYQENTSVRIYATFRMKVFLVMLILVSPWRGPSCEAKAGKL